MKAIKAEVYLQPKFIAAARQYLNTEGTQFLTVLQNGVLVVSTDKDALSSAISSLSAYVGQYTTEPMHVLSYNINYESYHAAH